MMILISDTKRYTYIIWLLTHPSCSTYRNARCLRSFLLRGELRLKLQFLPTILRTSLGKMGSHITWLFLFGLYSLVNVNSMLFLFEYNPWNPYLYCTDFKRFTKNASHSDRMRHRWREMKSMSANFSLRLWTLPHATFMTRRYLIQNHELCSYSRKLWVDPRVEYQELFSRGLFSSSLPKIEYTKEIDAI